MEVLQLRPNHFTLIQVGWSNCQESIKREIGNEEIGDCEYPKTQPTTSVLRNSAELKVNSATVTTPDSAEEVRDFRFWSK